jgi:hypothetical protein
MLEPAKLYEKQLNNCMTKTVLDPYYQWYHLQYPEPAVTIDDTFWNKTQLVSIEDGVVQGYFKATWQRPENYIDSITCANFNRENKNLFATDIRRFLKYLVYDLNISKIKWSVVIGNPIEKHYDRIIRRFSGRIIGIERYAYLINGKYYDRKIYEWINDYYECDNCGYIERSEKKMKQYGDRDCCKCLGRMVYRNPFMKGKY